MIYIPNSCSRPYLIYNGVKNYLLRQKISNTPTSTVEATAIGLVELSGEAECHDPTQSPVNRKECAYWRLTVEYYYHAGKPLWSKPL